MSARYFYFLIKYLISVWNRVESYKYMYFSTTSSTPGSQVLSFLLIPDLCLVNLWGLTMTLKGGTSTSTKRQRDKALAICDHQTSKRWGQVCSIIIQIDDKLWYLYLTTTCIILCGIKVKSRVNNVKVISKTRKSRYKDEAKKTETETMQFNYLSIKFIYCIICYKHVHILH